MEVYLVRHGQSEANAGLTKHLDSPLTDLGQAQARLTAQYLATQGITRAYVSPLIRTLQTMSPICAALGMDAVAFPPVCEYFSSHHPDFLTFQGLSPSEIGKRFPCVKITHEFSCDIPWWPDGFETRRTAYDRAVRVRDSLLSRFADTAEKILIVSHADPIGHLIEAITRVEPNPDCPPWSDNCAITRLRVRARSEAESADHHPLREGVDAHAPAEVITQNDSTHLASLYAQLEVKA